jgi:hypothetical protein
MCSLIETSFSEAGIKKKEDSTQFRTLFAALFFSFWSRSTLRTGLLVPLRAIPTTRWQTMGRAASQATGAT